MSERGKKPKEPRIGSIVKPVKEYKLTPEEMAYYRSLPPPKKEKLMTWR